MLRFAEEAEVPQDVAGRMIDDICEVAGQFSGMAENMYPRIITRDTLRTIQGRINENVALLRQAPVGRAHR